MHKRIIKIVFHMTFCYTYVIPAVVTLYLILKMPLGFNLRLTECY